jgi:hypothetical protein
VVEVKEKYFKTKMRADISGNVNAMIYFKFKLLLKFRNNANYCPVILNFHTVFC